MLPYFKFQALYYWRYKTWAGQLGSDRFYRGCSDVLLCILSIKTRSSMVIRLGFSRSCIIACSRLVNDIWPDNSFFDGFHFITTSNRRARNGSCGMADR